MRKRGEMSTPTRTTSQMTKMTRRMKSQIGKKKTKSITTMRTVAARMKMRRMTTWRGNPP
jgi:hypothetical protein